MPLLWCTDDQFAVEDQAPTILRTGRAYIYRGHVMGLRMGSLAMESGDVPASTNPMERMKHCVDRSASRISATYASAQREGERDIERQRDNAKFLGNLIKDHV